MRRALLLGAAALMVVAATVVALVLPTAPSGAVGDPYITRVFIPAIKTTCVQQAGVLGADIGYEFAEDGALHTLDPGDGTITGLSEEKLTLLNACLAQYPIEPSQELPHDPYSRNLLYDYFSGVLKGCLESRVGRLPPIPSRADFVVRLYIWDPYRALAPGLTLDQLLQLSAACPEMPPYLALSAPVGGTTPISHALAWRAQEDCLAAAGVDPEPSQSWSIEGQTVEILDAGGGVIATFTNAASGALAGRSLLNCLRSVPFEWVVSPPATAAQRTLLADYARHVLWPCLRSYGFDPGPTPDVAAYATAESTRDADPYATTKADRMPTEVLFALAAVCPAVPGYLMGAG
ncbi:MAG: hypothetical protein ABIQ01_06695 [Pseudolysinimonas sp.]